MGGLLVAIIILFVVANRLGNPLHENEALMQEAKAAVLAYVTQERKVPGSFSDVVEAGLLEGPPLDRWGGALTMSFDQGEVTILSLGPDAKPGGYGFRRDHKVKFEVE
ncbi:MAG: hypothetical protein AAF191_14105 [Verrucomicrobiota bacterium]